MARKAFRLVLGPGDAGSWNAVLRAGDHLDIGARQRPLPGAAVRWDSGSVADGGEAVRDRLLRRVERA